MSDISGALIGLVGGLLAALLVAWYQAKNTRLLITAEFEKLERQNRISFRARKEQWLLDTVPDLLAASDPELHATFDYLRVVSLIHKIQIILDPREENEGLINNAATELGFAVQAAITERRSVSRLLAAQDALVRAVRTYLRAT